MPNSGYPFAAKVGQIKPPNWASSEYRNQRVEWFQIVCFARLAEVCGEYLNKGRHIYLEGRLQTRKWKGPEGDKRTAIEVVANQMQILDRAPQNGNGAKAAETSKPAEPVEESANPFNEPEPATIEQEIPF